MKKLDHGAVLHGGPQEFLVLGLVLLFLDFCGVVQALEQRSVGGGGRLFRRLPELLLSRVAVHGADLEQAVAELLRRRVEIAGLRANNRPVIDKAKKVIKFRGAIATQLPISPQGRQKSGNDALGKYRHDVADVQEARAPHQVVVHLCWLLNIKLFGIKLNKLRTISATYRSSALEAIKFGDYFGQITQVPVGKRKNIRSASQIKQI